MRVFARRERPHPGAQLTLFEAEDGWRYTLWATNRPAATKGWLGQNAYIDAAHRVQARVEDAIRTGKDAGLGHFPSFDFGVNAAWLTAAMTGQILLGLAQAAGPGRRPGQSRAQDAALPGAARRGPAGPRRAAAPPENPGDLAVGRGDHGRLAAHRRAPASPLTSAKPSLRSRKENPGARGTPGHPARQPGHRHTPTLKSRPQTGPSRRSAPAINPDERSGLTCRPEPAHCSAQDWVCASTVSLPGTPPRHSTPTGAR